MHTDGIKADLKILSISGNIIGFILVSDRTKYTIHKTRASIKKHSYDKPEDIQ